MVMERSTDEEDIAVQKKNVKKRKNSMQHEITFAQKIVKTEEPTLDDSLKETKQTEDEQETAEHPEQTKRHRKRKRHYFNAIRTQMEFYFGDANLSKDRFLRKLIMDDPYVPLQVFMSFNKIKTLAKSVDEIAKSLSNSQLLELDENGIKVRRKTALPEERNVDDKTLYVESLPTNATHDWVKEVFERFGTVSYVSLPKYVKSRKIKEFGFVEFENEKSVRKAIKAFEKFDGVLKLQEADPAELVSVKSYIKEQNNEMQTETKEIMPEESVESKKRKKTKTFEEGLPSAKRTKKSDVEETNSESERDAPGTATSNGETADDENEERKLNNEEEAGQKVGKKKKMRKKKKSKNFKARNQNDDSAEDGAYFELKILSKPDWKRLRNKYLNLQRQKVGELKRKIWLERQQQQAVSDHAPEFEDGETKKVKTSSSERKLQAGMNMNFYGAGDDESAAKGVKEAKHNLALERAPLFSYEPGLIVEISLLEPCVNIKELKANMRQYATVKYVDVKEGSMQAHLRLESASAAEEFVQRINSAEYICKVLSGDAEKTYWHKIEQDREAKLNKQVKVPKKRGREKIKKLISQHVRFGDED